MKKKHFNTARALYYANLICQKIDFSSEAFLKRIGALRRDDKEGAEFIEKMMLEPLDLQIKYLATKASQL